MTLSLHSPVNDTIEKPMTGFIGLWPMTVNDQVDPLREKTHSNGFLPLRGRSDLVILVDRKGLLFHWQYLLGKSQ